MNTYGILNQYSKCKEAPPCTITVIITINEVVVNIACLTSETVLRIAKANDIAPRKPNKKIMKIFLKVTFKTT